MLAELVHAPYCTRVQHGLQGTIDFTIDWERSLDRPASVSRDAAGGHSDDLCHPY
jgi:hypothetical protein